MPPPGSKGRVPLSPESVKLLIGLLLLGTNLGVKFYLKAVRGERRLKELKAENVSNQLETLRYQINPHFFMNTLNNIHALVDVDPEKAKESIEEFSIMMRHVLYEGEKPTIPLSRELDFLRHYVSLMRIRYADTVQVELSLPERADGVEIPPLVLATFAENAFKHGISYEQPSFVKISLDLDADRVVFQCVNSRAEARKGNGEGIGLQNVRRRLDMLYGSGYTLSVRQEDRSYEVLLSLPAVAGLEKEEA